MSEIESFDCSHPRWELVCNRWANGTFAYWQRCVLCSRNIGGNGKWITKYEAEVLAESCEVDFNDLPIVIDNALLRPPCRVCGARGVDAHHWAPRELFGDECDLWPVDYLCPECHTRWHNMLRRTPLTLELDPEDPGRPF